MGHEADRRPAATPGRTSRGPGPSPPPVGAWRAQRPRHLGPVGVTLQLGLLQVRKPTWTKMDRTLNFARGPSLPVAPGRGEGTGAPASRLAPPFQACLPRPGPPCPHAAPALQAQAQARGVRASGQFWLDLGFWAAPRL